jgi:hypothetical protein
MSKVENVRRMAEPSDTRIWTLTSVLVSFPEWESQNDPILMYTQIVSLDFEDLIETQHA